LHHGLLVLLGHKVLSAGQDHKRGYSEVVGTSVIPIRSEGIYRLIWKAVEGRHPIEAVYNERHRLLCPHRLGRNKQGQLRVLCYQYGGESESGLQPVGSPANWRCIALEGLSAVKVLEGAWRTGSNHSRPTSCVTDADIDAEDHPERQPQKGH